MLVTQHRRWERVPTADPSVLEGVLADLEPMLVTPAPSASTLPDGAFPASVRRVPEAACAWPRRCGRHRGGQMERVGLGKAYQAPLLMELGSFSELTLGMGGSSPDGGSRGATQVGGMGQSGVSGAANGRR